MNWLLKANNNKTALFPVPNLTRSHDLTNRAFIFVSNVEFMISIVRFYYLLLKSTIDTF